jgi:rSAM/selenodomain-associated transferase 1
MRDALIVFAKVPQPGKVKTRLCPPLTPDEAADLYAALLADALDQYAALGPDVRLYLGGDLDAVPAELRTSAGSVHAQQGEGLGARMQRAQLETFAAGYDQCALIGTDHPTLPSAFVEHAFESLAEPRSIALGPTEDGGYYLLAVNHFFPSLFAGMLYSHARVFDETLARAAAEDAHVTVLPPWYDVDDAASLSRLHADLDAGDAHLAPRTRRWLAGQQG